MQWQPEFSIKIYKNEIQDHFIVIATCLLAELKDDSYDWEFIPTKDKSFPSHKSRTKNYRPSWYQSLLDGRRPNHKRSRTINAINRLIARSDGKQSGQRFIYDRMIREIIFDRLTEGFKDLFQIPYRNDVREYFDLETINNDLEEKFIDHQIHDFDNINEYDDDLENLSLEIVPF